MPAWKGGVLGRTVVEHVYRILEQHLAFDWESDQNPPVSIAGSPIESVPASETTAFHDACKASNQYPARPMRQAGPQYPTHFRPLSALIADGSRMQSGILQPNTS